MSFDYDKLKERQDNQSYWASTSDLFMVMSLVFLLMYVVTGLRTTTYSIKKQMEYKRISELNEDLKQQLKVYATLKDNYLETQASDDEMQVYGKLMGKLDLLKEKQTKEQSVLRQKIKEAQNKEQALNQYQQLVRNIINSNLMAKVAIKRRSAQLSKKNKKLERSLQNLKTWPKISRWPSLNSPQPNFAWPTRTVRMSNSSPSLVRLSPNLNSNSRKWKRATSLNKRVSDMPL